jgi:hypothetical protein
MNDDKATKENFEELTNKIEKYFYKMEFHFIFANSFPYLSEQKRSFKQLVDRYGIYCGGYFYFHRLLKRLVECGIIRKVQPIMNIGFHKGIYFDEYRKIVNKTQPEYKKFIDETLTERPEELKKEDFIKKEDLVGEDDEQLTGNEEKQLK